MFLLVLLWLGIYSGLCIGTQENDVPPPHGLSLGGILEGYSDCIPNGIRGKQCLNGEDWTLISLGCRQV